MQRLTPSLPPPSNPTWLKSMFPRLVTRSKPKLNTALSAQLLVSALSTKLSALRTTSTRRLLLLPLKRLEAESTSLKLNKTLLNIIWNAPWTKWTDINKESANTVFSMISSSSPISMASCTPRLNTTSSKTEEAAEANSHFLSLFC